MKNYYPSIEQVIERLQKGENYVSLLSACDLEKGIFNFDFEAAQNYYLKYIGDQKLVHFIPSSGAATRLFAFLYEKDFLPIDLFFENCGKLAIFPFLQEAAQEKGWEIEQLIAEKNTDLLLYLLGDCLGFLSMPKGLIPFYTDQNKTITPFEIHLQEAFEAKEKNIALHFTVAATQKNKIESFLFLKQQILAKQYQKIVPISFSIQNPATDVPILEVETKSFLRDLDGNLVLRPGGHGALLDNLASMEGDFFYIRNIDNVCPPSKSNSMNEVKNFLLGTLLQLQTKNFDFITQIKNNNLNRLDLYDFLTFFVPVDFDFEQTDDFYFNFLNRPLRVCGMVQKPQSKTGENLKGGGPFWLKNKTNFPPSVQIVETIEIDFSNPEQIQINEENSYFNPVLIVGTFKNFEGQKFNFFDYAASEKYFVSQRKIQGKKVSIYEHPGLWNGGMSDWLSVFVQVPNFAFNSVKSLHDLLQND